MKSITLTASLLASLALCNPVPPGTSACQTYTLLFARGTGEPGTLGSIVGPGLQKGVQSALSSVNVQGVSYPADAAGITVESGGSGPGSQAMLKLAQSTLSQCPQTRLILSGYSQGGMVVHNAAKLLGSQMSSVGAVVTFGDPDKSQKIPVLDGGKFKSFCAAGDSVCSYGACAGAGGCSSAGTSHLGYGSDTNAAAQFIKTAVGG